MAITTNTEYLQKTLQRFDMTPDDVELILAEHPGLNTGTLDVTACKKAMYASLSVILPTANVSEGGFSKSWNMEALILWYQSLCNELGLPNALKPKIRNRSDRW